MYAKGPHRVDLPQTTVDVLFVVIPALCMCKAILATLTDLPSSVCRSNHI